MSLEILHHPGAGDGRPPLLFVHGSFSGAWVWEDYFLPFFAARGWECMALSLRGHGGSPGAERLDHFGLSHYIEDVATAASKLDRPPVLIGHSLGGAVAQRFVTRHPSAGLVLLASVPPGGFASAAWWMVTHKPGFAWQMSVLETVGKHHVNPEILYRSLFSEDLPPAQAARFFPRLQRESRRALAEIMLPLHVWRPRLDYPTLILGGDNDAFIPVSALHATAACWHAQLIIQLGVPHVMMLDTTWARSADAVAAWLDERF